jgi:hypothetical protein
MGVSSKIMNAKGLRTGEDDDFQNHLFLVRLHLVG